MIDPVYERSGIRVYHGDCREVVAELAAQGEQFSAVVTDPPYGLSFMGRDWDHAVPGVAFWEAFRDAMLPGAHLLAFGGSRTYHRIAVAIEDAGLEIRDTLQWLYGSGFPKSLDVSKAIDKAAGVEREVIGKKGGRYASGYTPRSLATTPGGLYRWGDKSDYTWEALPDNARAYFTRVMETKGDITAPATDAAREWQGWGTALKPAYEPIILARKPFKSTVAANVLEHGTGALNIDASRIGPPVPYQPGGWHHDHTINDDGWSGGIQTERQPAGRWPTNVLLDETAAAQLDQMSGERKGRVGMTQHGSGTNSVYGTYARSDQSLVTDGYPDTGGASRFFPVLPIDDPDTLRFLYTPKASRSERNAGLEGLPEVDASQRHAFSGLPDQRMSREQARNPSANHHPTVKPLALMRWLLTLVTPPGGAVLDPFAGSGTTGVAAAQLGIPCVLIEQEAEYLPIIIGRIDHALDARAGAELPLFAGVAD